MNPDSTVEYNSLSWVKSQLDDVVSDAQASLNEYIENNVSSELENCIEYLQLIYGTLQMVEVYGASMLAEEMQLTASALLTGEIERAEDAYDVLMRAMLQLPDYLEGIQAGKKDSPITLMPLMNDLRTARKEGLLSESALFSPDLKNTELGSERYDSSAIESGKLQGEAKRLRTHYQLGLLDFIRNKKEQVGLQRIKAVLHALEKVSSNDEVRHLWMAVAALTEGLMKQGIEPSLSVNMLLAAVDRQLKFILDKGEEVFATEYSNELIKNVLYYVGLSTVNTKSISAVKDAYNLADLLPQEDDDSAAIGGLNADLFDTVSIGISEDLEKIKDVLELFMYSNEKSVEQLTPIADQIGKVADTYGMLGMGATRQSLMDQRVVIESIVDGGTEINDQVVMAVASELLNAESELKEYIDSRSGFVDMNPDKTERTVPAAEYRQVVHTVVTEALKNFGEAKEAILSYVSGIGDKGQLDIIVNRLEEVRGVSMILPLGRVESQIGKLQNFINVALIENNHRASENEQDTIADAVTSIEYFFEALSEGRPGVEHGLNAGDEAVIKLEEIVRLYESGQQVHLTLDEQQDAPVDELAELIEIDIDEADTEQSASQQAVVGRPDVSPSPVSEPEDAVQYSILADDADEEIVEIFIEEAIEVLGELHEHLPQWKLNNEDEEALAVVRRSFHTLKGSGRLLGAEMIGEFSWKFENLLNRVIDNRITVSDDLFNVLDESLAVLPQLIEQIKGNREPIDNIAQLMASADVLAEGKTVLLEVAEPIDLDVVDTDDSSVEQESLDIEYSAEEVIMPDISNELEMDAIEKITSSEDGPIVEDEIGGKATDKEVPDGSEGPFVKKNYEERTQEIDLETSEDENPLVKEDTSGGEFEIIIDENVEDVVNLAEDMLDIDPMLLKIYYDESQGHIETVRKLINESESGTSALKASKDLMRAFHTLYGSARTAEVEPIADLSGSAEKYVKVRQESGEQDIPDDVVAVFKEIEHSVSKMLSSVADGRMPVSNKPLQEKINKIVQLEIQNQLQQSWQDNAPLEGGEVVETISTDDSDIAIKEGELSVDLMDLTMGAGDDKNDEQTADLAVQFSYGDIDDELIDIFLEEAEELLENCEVTLNEIIISPNSVDHIQQLQRNMHTLKGGARMAELGPVGDLTHTLESLVVKVSENKVKADKPLFDLLQESLDALTNMLLNVRKREPLESAIDLNNRVEMLMRGEIEEKRAVERFDIELSELDSAHDEELETIDVSDFLPDSGEEFDKRSSDKKSSDKRSGDRRSTDSNKRASGNEQLRQTDGREKETEDRPHWGERATDVNYKDTQEQVRVRADLLNSLVNYAGEVNIYHARMGKQITDFGFNLSELTQTVVRLKEQLRNLEIETEIQIRSGYDTESDNYDADFDPLEMDQYSTLQQLTRSLSETAGDVDSIKEILTDITRNSETLLVQESRVSTDLQEGLMRTRMVRFGGLSSRLRRIVRQIARELGKEVEIEIEGESSEVDRTVLDRIIAPLEHMLRNAVAHGIELPEQRKALGKTEVGLIKMNIDRQGTNVVITIEDNGAGIDAKKVREKAVKQGLITYDSDISDHDAIQFILQSGFSTAEEVTQVAGRGVGMDVVDSEIKQLGGILDIETVQGQGTKFNILLPLTLAINQALLVSAGDDVFAVPLASIEGVVRITGYELQRFYDSGNSHYEFNNIDFELKHLGGLLTGNQSDYSKQLQLFPVLLVRVGDKHFALHVDDMLGRREIVVKPVGAQISTVRGIAGATILADGRVVLILEMSALVAADGLFKANVPAETVFEPVKEEKKTIMVVDDSITIRKITERMLKRYGIEVVLAKDGVDATSQLQDNIPDLMLLDIEMPRMDGFEVASFVRNDDRLKNIPIIMITSRTGVKHKEKAMEIGVNQYLGKPFQEDDLVNNINEILHTAF